MAIVKLALNVYDDYLFIFTEKDRIDQFLAQEPLQRDVCQAEINKYKATIEKIRNEMPYEIRMNMFLIKCNEINNSICDELDSHIETILSKVYDYVFVKMAPEITTTIKSI